MREEVGRIVGFDSPEGGTSLPAGNPEGVALGSRGRQPTVTAGQSPPNPEGVALGLSTYAHCHHG